MADKQTQTNWTPNYDHLRFSTDPMAEVGEPVKITIVGGPPMIVTLNAGGQLKSILNAYNKDPAKRGNAIAVYGGAPKQTEQEKSNAQHVAMLLSSSNNPPPPPPPPPLGLQ